MKKSQNPKERLKNIIDTVESGRGVRGMHITLYDLGLLIDYYHNHYNLTINENVKNILVSCGFKAVEYGIGWRITE